MALLTEAADATAEEKVRRSWTCTIPCASVASVCYRTHYDLTNIWEASPTSRYLTARISSWSRSTAPTVVSSIPITQSKALTAGVSSVGVRRRRRERRLVRLAAVRRAALQPLHRRWRNSRRLPDGRPRGFRRTSSLNGSSGFMKPTKSIPKSAKSRMSKRRPTTLLQRGRFPSTSSLPNRRFRSRVATRLRPAVPRAAH